MIRKPAGYVSFDGSDGSKEQYDTLQCVHCDGHWTHRPGSGRTRGWCAMCNGPHCGRRACWTCVPMEKKIDESLRRAAFAKAAGLVMK